MSIPRPMPALSILDLQTEVATALRDFYEFLTKLPWFQSDDVLEPPEHGWPSINADNFGPFHKCDTVIQLLKHLPYIRMDGPSKEYKVAWSTYSCDYRRDYFQQIKPNINCWEIPDTTERNFKFPEWVIPLTYGKVNGQYIMLDTTDGTAMRYEPLTLHDPIFEPEDSRVWRNECWNPESTARLSDVLDEMKVNYIDLYLIGHPTRYGPVLTTKSPNEKYQAQYQELRAIMLRHGWPDTFDREGCKNSMLTWDQEKSS